MSYKKYSKEMNRSIVLLFIFFALLLTYMFFLNFGLTKQKEASINRFEMIHNIDERLDDVEDTLQMSSWSCDRWDNETEIIVPTEFVSIISEHCTIYCDLSKNVNRSFCYSDCMYGLISQMPLKSEEVVCQEWTLKRTNEKVIGKTYKKWERTE